jgi:hypothetical protein
MSATGSAFKDWNADEAEMARAATGRRRALLVDDDFSWSDPPPARPRRAVPAPASRVTAVAERNLEVKPELDVDHELDSAWGGSLSLVAAAPAEVASWDESMLEPVPMDGPRTVVITGHGAERQIPMGRRQRNSELRIHERAGFSPDRVAMWAFLLGVALVLGAIIH